MNDQEAVRKDSTIEREQPEQAQKAHFDPRNVAIGAIQEFDRGIKTAKNVAQDVKGLVNDLKDLFWDVDEHMDPLEAALKKEVGDRWHDLEGVADHLFKAAEGVVMESMKAFTVKEAKQFAQHIVETGKDAVYIGDFDQNSLCYLDKDTNQWVGIGPGTDLTGLDDVVVGIDMESEPMIGGDGPVQIGEVMIPDVDEIHMDGDGHLVIISDDALFSSVDIEEQLLDLGYDRTNCQVFDELDISGFDGIDLDPNDLGGFDFDFDPVRE